MGLVLWPLFGVEKIQDDTGTILWIWQACGIKPSVQKKVGAFGTLEDNTHILPTGLFYSVTVLIIANWDCNIVQFFACHLQSPQCANIVISNV